MARRMYLMNEDEIRSFKDPVLPLTAQHMNRYAKPLHAAENDMAVALRNSQWSTQQRTVAHNDAFDRYTNYVKQVRVQPQRLFATPPANLVDGVQLRESTGF